MVTDGIGEGLGMVFSDTYNRQTIDGFAVLSRYNAFAVLFFFPIIISPPFFSS